MPRAHHYIQEVSEVGEGFFFLFFFLHFYVFFYNWVRWVKVVSTHQLGKFFSTRHPSGWSFFFKKLIPPPDIKWCAPKGSLSQPLWRPINNIITGNCHNTTPKVLNFLYGIQSDCDVSSCLLNILTFQMPYLVSISRIKANTMNTVGMFVLIWMHFHLWV